MKRRKLLIGVLCCLLSLFAFSTNVSAMDFDAEEAYQSIYVIYSGNSVGSGFAIGENTVVTNAHVVDNENEVYIHAYDGNVYKACVYLMDQSFDIAVLIVGDSSFTPLKIGDSNNIKAGDEIYAVGAPKSLDYSLTKGIVSNKSRKMGKYSYIQIDAAINAGNSGGPLLNSNGEVIGVNSMKMSDAEGIGLAIPILSVMEFISNGGIPLEADNTVDGKIEFSYHSPEKEIGNSTDNGVEFVNKKNDTVVILSILLALSVLLNAVLISIIMYLKNKNKDYIPDKSERTDFDIDIWG